MAFSPSSGKTLMVIKLVNPVILPVKVCMCMCVYRWVWVCYVFSMVCLDVSVDGMMGENKTDYLWKRLSLL